MNNNKINKYYNGYTHFNDNNRMIRVKIYIHVLFKNYKI